MGIGDLFRPKHKHSDAAVRAEAVQSLPEDDVQALLEVAREDEDPTVRALAIQKLTDPAILAELAASERQPGLKQQALARAAEVWVARAVGSEDSIAREAVMRVHALAQPRALADVARRAALPAVRTAAIELLNDPRALADVVRGVSDPETRLFALERIQDEEVLRAIAIDEQRREIATAALDRLHDPGGILMVATKGKVKAVRARARSRLTGAQAEAADAAEASAEKRDHAERTQLCREAEEIAGVHEWVRSRAAIESVEERWRAIGDGEDEALSSRFQQACARYRERYEKYGPAPVPEPLPVSVPVLVPADESIPAGPESASAPVPAPVSSPDSIAEEAKQKNLAILDDFISRLADLADKVDKIKTAEKWLARADKMLEEVGPLPSAARSKAIERFAEARRKLFIRAGELREADEWKRWANVPKQEELIAQVEAMVSTEDPRTLAKRLKEIQNEWRNVGPAPRDKAQELWNRFKAVCDLVYERVKEHRASAAVEQKENLRRKVELCEKAEALSDSTDWGPAAEELKRLQAEWKTVGPVPRRQSDKVWKRFRAACDRFFERRRPLIERVIAERSENMAQKLSICERVEALADSATDAEAAMRELADLRRAWRDVGPVPQKEFRLLADRFRAACDRVAAKRDQARAQEREQRRRDLEERVEALEAALTAAAQGGDGAGASAAEVARVAVELRNRIKESAQGFGDLVVRGRAALIQAVANYAGEFRGTELDPEVSRKRKEKLCARIEELANRMDKKQESSASPNTPEEMAARLRAALADRALGGVLSKEDSRPVRETVEDARESWSRLGPVPGEEGQALEARFERACRRALGDNVEESGDGAPTGETEVSASPQATR
jgi:hypothetical protein